ncbi:uncharacterized protein LOC143291754 isoform X3 [Babylonia areolata]|uniref:uncharacterized protein LOC143291754 isoform X3 n=1 Tax=Babylonia areolata TaxID=304850 RepID=UPI003FD61E9E
MVMLGWRTGGVLWWWVPLRQQPVVEVVVLVLWEVARCLGSSATSDSVIGLKASPFYGLSHIVEVECSGDGLPSGVDLLSITLYDTRTDQVLASVNYAQRKCVTAGGFTACHLDTLNSRNSKVRTLVSDLRRDEVRTYGCDVAVFAPGERPSSVSWSLAVQRSRTTTTVAPTTTTTTTTTIKPQPRSESPVASGVKSNVQEFQLPISVVIIGLVLLLFFAILCAILVILQCRGKRRRRSRAANRESLLSAKNEPMGEGGYRTPRNIPSYPPGHMPPETPGGNFAMRYQKSIPDTGYVSGSSVYYSEPYGTLDEEMKERLRPNPRMCHIPYDIKGGPLDTSHPQEHSA